MKLFQKLIAAPAIISLASGFAVNATEINSTDLSDYSNSNDLVSLVDFKSDTLFPGDWAYDSLKNLTNSSKFNGNSVSRLEAAAELSNLIALFDQGQSFKINCFTRDSFFYNSLLEILIIFCSKESNRISVPFFTIHPSSRCPPKTLHPSSAKLKCK